MIGQIFHFKEHCPLERSDFKQQFPPGTVQSWIVRTGLESLPSVLLHSQDILRSASSYEKKVERLTLITYKHTQEKQLNTFINHHAGDTAKHIHQSSQEKQLNTLINHHTRETAKHIHQSSHKRNS